VTKAIRGVAVGALMLLFAAQPASAATPIKSVKATTSNPYKDCHIGSGPPEWETQVYVGAEVEPSIAVNPTNRKNIIGVVQQDRWNDGGAHGLVAMVSHDGGSSFHVVALPFSSCAPGGLNYERASDPWVSFGPDGTAYTVSISFDENSTRGDVAVATSSDGGNTWGNDREIATDTDYFNDKESVTADPTRPGYAYVVWDRAPYCCSFPGPSYISRTTDYGQTWSAPMLLTQSKDQRGDIGNLIVVDPRTGVLYDFINRFFNYNRTEKYVVLKSTDAGQTWSEPYDIALDKSIYFSEPRDGGLAVRSGNTLPEAAIDPNTGRLYMVWEDARYTGGQTSQVLMSTSTNGRVWGKPKVISEAPAFVGQHAFVPAVAVNADGKVAVTYYQFGDVDPFGDSSPTNYWVRISSDGGGSFGAPRLITNSPFNMTTAPDAGGLFLGDYEGLTSFGSKFYSLYCKTTGNPNHSTNCFVAKITP